MEVIWSNMATKHLESILEYVEQEFGDKRVKGQVIEPSVINIDKWHGQQEYDPTAECITLY